MTAVDHEMLVAMLDRLRRMPYQHDKVSKYIT